MSGDFLKRNVYFKVILIIATVLAVAMIGNVRAQNSKTVGQLNFQVPDDWPIEKRGGLMTPIPTEEYVMIKFKEIEREFLTIKEEFKGKFDAIQSNLSDVESSVSKDLEKIPPQDEASRAEAGGDLTEVLSSFESLRSELGRLDRKVADKSKETQSKLDKISLEIDYIKENLDGLQTQIYRIEEKVDYLDEARDGSY